MQARRGARPVLQSEGGVLSLANGVSPPPSPCSRVHQPHLNPGLPAPQTCSPSTAPAPVHTPGLTTPCSASAPALWPLAFCLPSHCLADGALPILASEQGQWLQPQGDRPGSPNGHRHQVILGSRSPVLEAPRLPLGVAGGCRAGTQAPEPLFVQAKVSLPPPSLPGLDQWPRAMARVSGPCPLWPVAPGSMGLLPGSGRHCD